MKAGSIKKIMGITLMMGFLVLPAPTQGVSWKKKGQVKPMAVEVPIELSSVKDVIDDASDNDGQRNALVGLYALLTVHRALKKAQTEKIRYGTISDGALKIVAHNISILGGKIAGFENVELSDQAMFALKLDDLVNDYRTAAGERLRNAEGNGGVFVLKAIFNEDTRLLTVAESFSKNSDPVGTKFLEFIKPTASAVINDLFATFEAKRFYDSAQVVKEVAERLEVAIDKKNEPKIGKIYRALKY